MSSWKVRYEIRIDETNTGQILRPLNQMYPIFNGEDGKMYRMKIISGELTQQEIVITDGVIVETGSPIVYVQK